MPKITTLFLVLSFITISAFAQDPGVYIKAGMNIANISTSSNGRIDKANSLISFHAGLMGDIPLSKEVSFQPGILFTGKGAKSQTGQQGGTYYYSATSNPYYIELPLNLVFKMPISNESSFFVGAGPYAAMGIAGKNKVAGNAGLVAFSGNDPIKYTSDDPTTFNQQEGAGLGIMRRFDFGVNATAGLQLDMILISANYGYGLTKINSVEKNTDDKNKHRVFSFSIGFRL
jgi:hypothetical protein